MFEQEFTPGERRPRVSTEPPIIRSERQDWHALNLSEQVQVLTVREGRIDLEQCDPRAQVFLRRHGN